jgi:hypothetical protein
MYSALYLEHVTMRSALFLEHVTMCSALYLISESYVSRRLGNSIRTVSD